MIIRREEALREGALRAAEHNLAAFLRLVWPEWGWSTFVWAPHLDVACLVFEQWVRGMLVPDPEALGLPIQVVANLPPQTTKTTVFGRAGPLWAQLQAHGTLRLLHASHTLEGNLDAADAERMAVGTSRRFLDLVDSRGDPWRWGKAEENEQTIVSVPGAGERARRRGGIALASWVGGAGTGRHFNGHYYDDLCKRRDVHQPKARALWRRMIDELQSRYAQRLRHAFFSMQRFGSDDPVADWLEEYPEAVRFVLPRVFETGRTDYPERLDLGVPSDWVLATFDGERALQPYRERLERAGFWLQSTSTAAPDTQRRLCWRDWRREGESLDPARCGRADEARLRRNLRRWFAEQQQRPSKADGVAIIPASAWGTWRAAPATTPAEITMSIDPQSGDPSKRKAPDRTALLVGARWGGMLHLLERVNGIHTFTQVCALLWVLSRRWVPHRILVEDAAGGSEIVAHLRGEGLPLILVRPEGTTPSRVNGASGAVIAGNVLLPDGGALRPAFLRPEEPWPGRTFEFEEVPRRLRPGPGVVEPFPMPLAPSPAIWRPEFIEEIASIPGGFDDDGDALAYLVRDMQLRLGDRPKTSRSSRRQQTRTTAAERHGVTQARPAGRLRWS